MQKDFLDSYRSTQWQEKKNKILTRDNYTCAICGKHGDEHTLMHVHHLTYKNCKNHHAWDCPDEDLVTLCEDCHKKVHSKKPFTSSLENYFYLESQQLINSQSKKDVILSEGSLSFIAKGIHSWVPNYSVFQGFAFISNEQPSQIDEKGTIFTVGVMSDHYFYCNDDKMFLGMDIDKDFLVFPSYTLLAKFVAGLSEKIRDSSVGEINPYLTAHSELFFEDYINLSYDCYLILSRMFGWRPTDEESFMDNSFLNCMMTTIMGPMWPIHVETVYSYDEKEASDNFNDLYKLYMRK